MKLKRNVRTIKKYRGGWFGEKNEKKTDYENERNWSRYWKKQHPTYNPNKNYPGITNFSLGVTDKPDVIDKPILVTDIKYRQDELKNIKMKINTIPPPAKILTITPAQSSDVSLRLSDLKTELQNSIIDELTNPDDTLENLMKKQLALSNLKHEVKTLLKDYTTANYGNNNPIIDQILQPLLTGDSEIIWQKLLKVISNLTVIEKVQTRLRIDKHAVSTKASYWEYKVEKWSKCSDDRRGNENILGIVIYDYNHLHNKYTKDLLETANEYRKQQNEENCNIYYDPLTNKKITSGGSKTKKRRSKH